MAHKSNLIAGDIEEYLKTHQHKSLLRFMTCGSVDDGKSTLIGRLLYESKMIFEDQLAALEALIPRKSERRAMTWTWRFWWTAWRLSASKALPSMSPTAFSRPTGESSSWPIRPDMSSTRAIW
jgi:hypothetical protein